jgi:hypothetical protein
MSRDIAAPFLRLSARRKAARTCLIRRVVSRRKAVASFTESFSPKLRQRGIAPVAK